MDIVHDRAVGMDISKRDAKVCVRGPGPVHGQFISTVTTWGATTNQILELRKFLEGQHVTIVVMEATSDYWKPFFYLLEESLPVELVNAKSARNIPGRKTDVLTELVRAARGNRRRRRFASDRFCSHGQRGERSAGTVRSGGAAVWCAEGHRQSVRTVSVG